MKTNRERMVDALASWVRTLEGQQYEHYRWLNISGLKDAVEHALNDATTEAIAEEREACAKVAYAAAIDGPNASRVAAAIRARVAK